MAKELIPKDQRVETVLALIAGNKAEFERALPKMPGLEVERWVRIVVTTLRRNPDLALATPESLMAGLMECAQAGLEPHRKGGVWFTGPYRNKIKVGNEIREVLEVVPVWDYRAEIAVMRRSGEIEDVYAECVWERDTYQLTLGLNRNIKHEPYRGEDHGDLVAAYAVAQYKSGKSTFAWLWRWQIDKHRASSKAPDGPMWKNWLEEAAKKSAVHALSDYVPMSTSDRDLLSADSERLRLGIGDVAGVHEPSRIIEMPKTDSLPPLPEDATQGPAGNGAKGEPPKGDKADKAVSKPAAKPEQKAPAPAQPATQPEPPAAEPQRREPAEERGASDNPYMRA